MYPSVSAFTNGVFTHERELNESSLSQLNLIRAFVSGYSVDLKIFIRQQKTLGLNNDEVLIALYKKLEELK
jgi:hypothetical protein